MNLAKRIAELFSFGGKPRDVLDGVYRSRIGDPPKRGTLEFLQAYQSSPWLRAVVGKISDSIGETEWSLEAKGRELDEHLMLTVLRRPNPVMTGAQLMACAQQHLETVGDCFLLKERNGFGAPIGLYPLPPHWIAEIPTPSRPYFQIRWLGAQERIPDTEIMWVRIVAPADPYGRGSGMALALGDEIGTDEYAAKHAQGLFFNRAQPDFVVMDEGAGEPELARHEQHWRQRLQGFFKSFKPYFVNRKLEFWQPNQQNLENLTLVPLRKHERDIILQTWGMPPEQLGIVESSNRATAEASDYIYEKRIVRPRRKFWRDAFQQYLVPEYDARLVVKYVDTVPEDKAHALATAKAAPWSISRDEWRALGGHPPAEDGTGELVFVPLQGYLADDPEDLEKRPQAGAGGRPEEAEPKEPEKEEANA